MSVRGDAVYLSSVGVDPVGVEFKLSCLAAAATGGELNVAEETEFLPRAPTPAIPEYPWVSGDGARAGCGRGFTGLGERRAGTWGAMGSLGASTEALVAWGSDSRRLGGFTRISPSLSFNGIGGGLAPEVA